jgi:hypothetical protein
MKSCNYEIVIETPHVLIIRDVGPWDQHPTVTNDANEVVRELAPRLGARRLLYIDSEGELDELRVKERRFVGFAPGIPQ